MYIFNFWNICLFVIIIHNFFKNLFFKIYNFLLLKKPPKKKVFLLYEVPQKDPLTYREAFYYLYMRF